jgi:hypothetical protein
MGCCISVSKSTNYDVVLKIPGSKNYLHYANNKFIKKSDINEWLKSLYSKNDIVNYIVYNDEHEDKVNGTCGHCKGVLTWNKTSITWLVHSVPKFPENFNGKEISELPESGIEFGQSFIFVHDIDIMHLNVILENLYAMHPAVYITTIDIPKRFKTFENKLLKPINISENISHIAKSSSHNLDIYEHLARYHKGVWICRTWIRGHECQETYYVKNNKVIMYENITYKHTQDHSKYACNDEYVIIGDLNRMTTQFERGGGGILIKDKKLATQINKLFVK